MDYKQRTLAIIRDNIKAKEEKVEAPKPNEPSDDKAKIIEQKIAEIVESELSNAKTE
jgi:hypothetical protein